MVRFLLCKSHTDASASVAWRGRRREGVPRWIPPPSSSSSSFCSYSSAVAGFGIAGAAADTSARQTKLLGHTRRDRGADWQWQHGRWGFDDDSLVVSDPTIPSAAITADRRSARVLPACSVTVGSGAAPPIVPHWTQLQIKLFAPSPRATLATSPDCRTSLPWCLIAIVIGHPQYSFPHPTRVLAVYSIRHHSLVVYPLEC